MTAGNARQHHRQPTAVEREQHQEMVRRVFDWMRRTQGTQQLLVRCIEGFWRRRGLAGYRCDHSLLSRILNPVAPHVPTLGRPKSMRILQAVLVICTPCDDPNVIECASDEDLQWSSDAEQAFKIHRARLRQLREVGRASLFQSLHRLGEFAAIACWMDDTPPPASGDAIGETLRRRACENVLLTLAALIDPGQELHRLRDRLIADGVAADEAARLEAQQVERVDAVLAATKPDVNLHGYGGAALFHCGQRERGMAMLLDAVAHGYDIQRRHDPHWETLLDLLDTCLRHNLADARAWSLRAAEIARLTFAKAEASAAAPDSATASGGRQLLIRAWRMVDVPLVRAHWLAGVPGVVERIERDGSAADTSGPSTADAKGGTRAGGASGGKAGRASAIKRLMVALTTLLTIGLGGDVRGDDGRGASAADGVGGINTVFLPATRATTSATTTGPASVQLSIRGREAHRPKPPPPPDSAEA